MPSIASSDEAIKVFNNPLTAYKAKLASCKAKKTSHSLSALNACGKAKAQCSAKFQACKAIALLCSAKKASGEAMPLAALKSLLAKLVLLEAPKSNPFTRLK